MSEVSRFAPESLRSKIDKDPEPSSLTIAQELAIHFFTEGRPVFDRFMNEYVGHPNPQLRLRGARPSLIRQRFKPDAAEIFEWREKFDFVDYPHELFAGYSQEGSLLIAMAATEADSAAKDYLVVLAHQDGTIQEPRILRADMSLDADNMCRETRLSMMGGRFATNAPPNTYPDTQSQWRLSIPSAADARRPQLTFGRGRTEEFYPIEELCDAIDERNQFQQISKGGLTLVFSRNL